MGVEVPGLGRPNVLASNPYLPSDVSSLQCPFWINELRGGDSDLPISSGQQYRSTNISMNLCVVRREGETNLKYSDQLTAEWVDAVYSTFAQHVRLSAPAVKIKSSTNANPSVVTTGIPHGLVTGNQAIIQDHLMNTAINGSWNVTVIDYVRFSVPVLGNANGGATGTVRKLQPHDMTGVVDAVIRRWDKVPLTYGSTDENMPNYLALQFDLVVREMYVTTIQE